MEPMFENRYTTNHRMLSEFMRKYLVGPRMPTVAITTIAYGWFGFYCYKAGMWNQMKLLWVIALVFFVVVFFLPHYMTAGSIRNVKKENGGQVPETVLTFGEKIHFSEGEVEMDLEYAQIFRVVRLKHSYALLATRRSGILLDPQGFTKGSFAQFKAFLREKRPDLKIPE